MTSVSFFASEDWMNNWLQFGSIVILLLYYAKYKRVGSTLTGVCVEQNYLGGEVSVLPYVTSRGYCRIAPPARNFVLLLNGDSKFRIPKSVDRLLELHVLRYGYSSYSS